MKCRRATTQAAYDGLWSMEVIYFVSRLRISFSVKIAHAKRAFHFIRSSSLCVNNAAT
jgi:hypothetical protein